MYLRNSQKIYLYTYMMEIRTLLAVHYDTKGQIKNKKNDFKFNFSKLFNRWRILYIRIPHIHMYVTLIIATYSTSSSTQ